MDRLEGMLCDPHAAVHRVSADRCHAPARHLEHRSVPWRILASLPIHTAPDPSRSIHPDLATKASQLTMYDLKSYYNQAKNMVLNVSEMEAKVREATNDEAW